jgi:ATP-dependent DNA helicase PIF1
MSHRVLIDGAIYTPLNADVKDVNEICMKKLPGKSKMYLSADSILENDHQEAIPTEYLNSLSVSGLPDHQLELKVGAPVMLLRNLQGGQNNSLRNGTRMIVVNMMDRCLECEVATGSMKGLRVYLPRIPHHDSTNDFPFTIVRRQFPVRPAFCITINKVS